MNTTDTLPDGWPHHHGAAPPPINGAAAPVQPRPPGARADTPSESTRARRARMAKVQDEAHAAGRAEGFAAGLRDGTRRGLLLGALLGLAAGVAGTTAAHWLLA